MAESCVVGEVNKYNISTTAGDAPFSSPTGSASEVTGSEVSELVCAGEYASSGRVIYMYPQESPSDERYQSKGRANVICQESEVSELVCAGGYASGRRVIYIHSRRPQ